MAQLGKYVVAVDVREYRRVNGQEVLVGTTRRDIQLVARACEPNKPPVFAGAAPTAPREYTVAEGATLNLTVAATDPENQLLTLRATSVLLDGPGGFAATFNGDPGPANPRRGRGHGAGARPRHRHGHVRVYARLRRGPPRALRPDCDGHRQRLQQQEHGQHLPPPGAARPHHHGRARPGLLRGRQRDGWARRPWRASPTSGAPPRA